MSETQGQRNDSPLLSERGVTTISDTVVSSLAGMAAQEVDGVHMGGGASRAAGGVLGSITGSESRTSGITVEVGRTETAIDLKMGIEYNKNILQTVEEVRRRITDRVESMTGLRIKELNATITDITFPETEARRRLGRAKPSSEPDESQEETPATVTEARTTPEDETTEPAERETTQAEATEPETTQVEMAEAEATEAETDAVETAEVEPTSRTHTEAESGPVPEEEVSVEGRSLEEDETAEVRMEEETAEVRVEEEQTDEAPVASEDTRETPAETETTQETRLEPETPEARMRRRAEERARRRRRRTQDS